MSWIAKILTEDPDEYSHARLVKYGIGQHVGPRVKLTFSKSSIKFKADLDMEKDILLTYLSGAPEGRHKVKGNIITYSDRREAFGMLQMPLEWKKSSGTFKSKVSETAPLQHIKELFEAQDPTTFYLLSLNPASGGSPWKVTTKTSFPKGAPKGGEDEEDEKDPTFVKGSFANTPEIMDQVLGIFVPDFKDSVTPKTKKVDVWNAIIIEDIEIPQDPKLSISEKRRMAKKRGKIARTVSIDGKEYTHEYSFVVSN
jgi:hypothetical protein